MKSITVKPSIEDFAESSKTIKKPKTLACQRVTSDTQTLMMEVTTAIFDGDVSLSKMRIYSFRDTIADFVTEFDTVQRAFDATMHRELLGESFFLLELSAYTCSLRELT